MTDVYQGEVYWLDFGPATGSAPALRRPCVVVQSDVFNRSRIATTVVCIITSNLSRADSPGNVSLKAGDAKLPRDSVINVTQLYTVDKLELAERIGKLPHSKLESVLAGLELLFQRVGIG